MKLIQSTVKTATRPTILIVKENLKKEGLLDDHARLDEYNVLVAEDSAAALLMAPRISPNLIVLGVGLTKVRWIEFFCSIRKDSTLMRTPLLISTNDADAVCNLTDFGLANTDFIVEPFTPQELILRMRRLLYNNQLGNIETSVFTYGDMQLDVARYEVEVGGNEVHLTSTEFKLLATLAQRRGRVQSREMLLQDVFSYNTSDIETRTIDTHMRRLRQKLGGAQWHLETVRGVGYRFREKSANESHRWKFPKNGHQSRRRHSISRS
jgi:DNA-binding response OmpR family regulator